MKKDITQLRCIEDNFENYFGLFEKVESHDISQRMELLSNSLKVSFEITPKISMIISKVINELNISELQVECYISNSPEMNAYCFSLGEEINIILVLSSALVNAMNENELAFVIGHEVGHYVLGHLNYVKQGQGDNDLLKMKLSRISQSQEISADRIGLICSGSIESSLKAIIKTVSGLGDEFITNSLHKYLNQVQLLDYSQLNNAYDYSHPVFPIRAKSLMLFSMSDLYYEWKGDSRKAPIKRDILEHKIINDLESTTLKNEKFASQEITRKFKMWFFIKSFIDDGKIDSEEMHFLEQNFGEQIAEKAIHYAKGNPDGVTLKYVEFKEKMQALSLSHVNNVFHEMEDMIEGSLSNHKIHKYFLNIKQSFHYKGK
ncbi:MAG: M48 family metallopeptidase [Sulfurospirillaceae bacterium]|nr:M48 family metallopeptidase [Sulfurospirillaceae bacterium]